MPRRPTAFAAEAVAAEATAAVLVNVADVTAGASGRRPQVVLAPLALGGGSQRVNRALLFHVFEGRLERSDHPQLQIKPILYSVERNELRGIGPGDDGGWRRQTRNLSAIILHFRVINSLLSLS